MILVYIVLIVLSLAIAFLGRNRKFGFWGYLFCSLFFTPIVGLLLLIGSDRRPAPAKK